MKKLFLIPLLLVSLTITAAAPPNEVVQISILEVFDDSLDDEIEQLEEAIGQPGVRKIDLLLNSPGGYVHILRRIEALLNEAREKGIIVHTNISRYAASCGADLFMQGSVRIMGVNDEILFHEISIEIDGISLTVSEIREIVQTGTLTHAVESGTISFMQSTNGRKWIAENMSEMQSELPRLEASMRAMDEQLAEQLGKPYEWVKAHVCVPFKDTWFTGREALRLGIATELDRS